MKLQHLFFIIPSLLLTGYFVSGQETDGKKASGIFSKGKNRILLERNFSYRNFENNFNDVKTGRTNRLMLHGEYSRFLVDGVAVGLDVDAEFSGYHPVSNSDVLVREWSVAPHVIYGTSLGGAINIYGKAEVGLGSVKTIYQFPAGNDVEDKQDLFGYGITVGLPILTKPKTNTYLTPYLSYQHLTYDFDDGKEKINQLVAGFSLESYLFCNEMRCDKNFSRDKYDQGSSYIGYYTRGSIGFGKDKTEYDAFPATDEEKFTDGNLKLDYVYYPIDYLGVGAGIGITGEVHKPEDSDNKYTASSFSFMPQVVLHVPTDQCYRNLFLQVEGKFGFESQKYTISNVTTTDKYNQTGLSLNLGYNKFFSQNLAFTTLAGYQWRTVKEKDTDNKDQDNGFGVQGGIRFFF